MSYNKSNHYPQESPDNTIALELNENRDSFYQSSGNQNIHTKNTHNTNTQDASNYTFSNPGDHHLERVVFETQPIRKAPVKGRAESKSIQDTLYHLNPDQLIQGILLSEILGKPLSQRTRKHRF